jgi:hypothetical protein
MLYVVWVRILGCFVLWLFFGRRNQLFDPQASKGQLAKAPGARLLALVDFFFAAKIVEQTFLPLVADWRTEYFEAWKQSRKWKARWVSTRYRCAFVWAMTLSKVFSLLKQLKSVSK